MLAIYMELMRQQQHKGAFLAGMDPKFGEVGGKKSCVLQWAAVWTLAVSDQGTFYLKFLMLLKNPKQTNIWMALGTDHTFLQFRLPTIPPTWTAGVEHIHVRAEFGPLMSAIWIHIQYAVKASIYEDGPWMWGEGAESYSQHEWVMTPFYPNKRTNVYWKDSLRQDCFRRTKTLGLLEHMQ